MKSPRFFTLFTLLSLTSAFTVRAEKLDDWFKLLPKNTVGVIAIKNTPELLADWDKSSFAKLLEDEDFKKWTAPMMKNGEAPWDKASKESSGEGLHDNLKRYPGASMAVFTGDGPEDFEGDTPPICALSEAGGQEKALEEMKAKEFELAIKNDENLKQTTQEIEGVTVHVLAPAGSEDGWEKGYAFVDDVLVEASNLKQMVYFITALKSGSGEGADVVTNHLSRLAQLTEGHTDVLVYLNGETLVQWGLTAAKTAASENAQAQAMPVTPDSIIAALGVEELQSMALMLDITDEQSRMEVALLHPEKPVGLVTLMRGTSGEVILPSFIPADVISGSVMRYSMLDLWDNLLGMINKLGPMAAMATMQLGGAEAQAGVKIRDDLFASLDDEYIEMTDGTLDKQSQVLAFKVKDKERLGGAIDGIKRFAGGGFAAFEESEFLGYQISMIKSANAQPGATEVGFCLTEDYLIFSTGPQALLKKVLSRMKEPSGPSVWENDRVQDLLTRLPAGYIGAGVADGGKLMKVFVDAMGMVQGQAAKTAKKKGKGKGKKGPGEGSGLGGLVEEEAKEDTWFDPNAIPPDAMWKRYFGTNVSGYYNPADAIYYRSVTTPVAAQ
ncbi:hypothetical protein EI77_02077 [Prosthecobacter fusiformis]|uniref:DUF3352 domain-containing protein n=1 Tax=Prosthecobacter fusiformis TaxID=48464 RepID=A0A4R7RZW4_9BACT|nr:hypothetical protein [Prosthecobacter fusiformis]TDU70959.1 hypothetical protein EI77_02077 [Prosthecobacter fusiformis]